MWHLKIRKRQHLCHITVSQISGGTQSHITVMTYTICIAEPYFVLKEGDSFLFKYDNVPMHKLRSIKKFQVDCGRTWPSNTSGMNLNERITLCQILSRNVSLFGWMKANLMQIWHTALKQEQRLSNCWLTLEWDSQSHKWRMKGWPHNWSAYL